MGEVLLLKARCDRAPLVVARDVPFVTGLRRELDVGRVVVPTPRRGRDTLRVAAGLRAPERGAAVALEVALTAGGFLEVALRSRQAFNLAARLAAAPCMETRDPAHPSPNRPHTTQRTALGVLLIRRSCPA